MSLPDPLATSLGGDGSIGNQSINHVALALDRLAFQFKDKPNFVGLITKLVTQCQVLEAVIEDLQNLPSIDLSNGAQLDIIGSIIGEPRGGFDDGSYRLHLKARVWLNRCSGVVDDFYSMFTSILGPDVAMFAEEDYPASFIFHVWGTQLDSVVANYLVVILKKAKALGVKGYLNWLAAAPGQSFCFAGGSGLGFDGGIWSSVG